jgi:hypothetical protein
VKIRLKLKIGSRDEWKTIFLRDFIAILEKCKNALRYEMEVPTDFT